MFMWCSCSKVLQIMPIANTVNLLLKLSLLYLSVHVETLPGLLCCFTNPQHLVIIVFSQFPSIALSFCCMACSKQPPVPLEIYFWAQFQFLEPYQICGYQKN